MRRAVILIALVVSCVVCFFSYGDTRAAERTVGFNGAATARSVLVTAFTSVLAIGAAGCAALALIHALMRVKREPFVHCLVCGYSSREVPRITCPECGLTRLEADAAHRRDTLRACGRLKLAALAGLAIGSVAAESWLLVDDAQYEQEKAGIPVPRGVRARAVPFDRYQVGEPIPMGLVRTILPTPPGPTGVNPAAPAGPR